MVNTSGFVKTVVRTKEKLIITTRKIKNLSIILNFPNHKINPEISPMIIGYKLNILSSILNFKLPNRVSRPKTAPLIFQASYAVLPITIERRIRVIIPYLIIGFLSSSMII